MNFYRTEKLMEDLNVRYNQITICSHWGALLYPFPVEGVAHYGGHNHDLEVWHPLALTSNPDCILCTKSTKFTKVTETAMMMTMVPPLPPPPLELSSVVEEIGGCVNGVVVLDPSPPLSLLQREHYQDRVGLHISRILLTCIHSWIRCRLDRCPPSRDRRRRPRSRCWRDRTASRGETRRVSRCCRCRRTSGPASKRFRRISLMRKNEEVS